MDTIRQRNSAGPFEKGFAFFVLLLSTQAFLNLTVTRGGVQDEASGQASMQMLWMLLYAIAIVMLLRNCRSALKTLLREYLLLGLVALALVSTSWSDDPSLSLRRSVALVLTCLFGAYFGLRFTFREQLRLLACVAGTCVVFSLFFGLFRLGTPSEDLAPAWYGVFLHKNDLGRMMVLSMLVFLILLKSGSQKRALLWIASGLAFLLLLLSRSTTSLVVLAAMLVFFPVCSVLSRNPKRVIKTVLAICAVAALALYWAWTPDYLWEIPKLLNKDLTLTGRVQLWILSTAMALRRPWLGYGYNAFWLGSGSVSAKVWAITGWDAPHAHNGLLELWLELGLLGVVLFVAGFSLYFVRAIGFLRRSQGAGAVWPLLFLVLMVMTNLTEATILSRNNIFWILYTAMAVTVSRTSQKNEEFFPQAIPEGQLA